MDHSRGNENSVEEFVIDTVTTSTPLTLHKNSPGGRLPLDNLDISIILESPGCETPRPYHLNITTPLQFHLSSFVEFDSEDFVTAWEKSTCGELKEGQVTNLTPYDGMDTRVEVLATEKPDNEWDRAGPCMNAEISNNNDVHRFVTLRRKRNFQKPLTAAVPLPQQERTNFFQEIKTFVLFSVKQIIKASSRTLGIKKRGLRRTVEAENSQDSKLLNNNNNATLKPSMEICNVFVTLTRPDERRIYKSLYFLTMKEFQGYLSFQTKVFEYEKEYPQHPYSAGAMNLSNELETRMRRVSQQLLYLRQFLVSPNLIQSAVENSQDGDMNSSLNTSWVFSSEYKSAKLERVYEELELIKSESPMRKLPRVVIVTQFEAVIETVKYHLFCNGLLAEIITDDMTQTERQFVVSQFSMNSIAPDILIFTSRSLIKSGWDLKGVRYLFLLDNHWDPTMEIKIFEQIDRQPTMPITIKRFVTLETIEKVIDEIRENKLVNDMELHDPTSCHFLNKKDIFKLFGAESCD